VARQAGEVIGCGAAVMQPEGYAEIKRMFVRAPARGQGVGRQILAFLEDQLRLRQIGLVRLETGIDSPEALRLYAGMGYVRTPPFADYKEDPLSIFYAKELVGPTSQPQTHPQEE
jgi:putative acetyltransferase